MLVPNDWRMNWIYRLHHDLAKILLYSAVMKRIYCFYLQLIHLWPVSLPVIAQCSSTITVSSGRYFHCWDVFHCCCRLVMNWKGSGMKWSRSIEGNIILLENCEPRRKINGSRYSQQGSNRTPPEHHSEAPPLDTSWSVFALTNSGAL